MSFFVPSAHRTSCALRNLSIMYRMNCSRWKTYMTRYYLSNFFSIVCVCVCAQTFIRHHVRGIVKHRTNISLMTSLKILLNTRVLSRMDKNNGVRSCNVTVCYGVRILQRCYPHFNVIWLLLRSDMILHSSSLKKRKYVFTIYLCSSFDQKVTLITVSFISGDQNMKHRPGTDMHIFDGFGFNNSKTALVY